MHKDGVKLRVMKDRQAGRRSRCQGGIHVGIIIISAKSTIIGTSLYYVGLVTLSGDLLFALIIVIIVIVELKGHCDHFGHG